MSSVYGEGFKLTIFGQSHSAYVGAVIDGLEAGFYPDLNALARFMSRRAPSSEAFSTARKESDSVEIVSGLFNGATCGAPLCLLIKNSDARPSDYEKSRDIPRPSHSDFCSHVKYNAFNDYCGGGHSSGRLTAPLCAAGGLIIQLLNAKNIHISAHIYSIGEHYDTPFDDTAPDMTVNIKPFPVFDSDKSEQMKSLMNDTRERGDSVGGEIECAITGLPVGVGEPMFGGLENEISRTIFAIPAVKGIEFGNTTLFGSENNDALRINEGKIQTQTNHAGGINGGMANGMPVIFRVKIKPTPSIALRQDSVNLKTMSECQIEIGGRHDACIVPRAVPCVEAAAAIAIYNLICS